MAHKGKWKRADVLKLAAEIEEKTKGTVSDIMFCGSFRRGKDLLGDLDVVVVPVDFKKFERIIMEMSGKILASGQRIIRILSLEGIQVDFMIAQPEYFQSAVLHSTGDKWFNIRCRKRAQDLGLRLSQYGLMDETGTRVAVKEIDILQILGMEEFIDPTKRR